MTINITVDKIYEETERLHANLNMVVPFPPLKYKDKFVKGVFYSQATRTIMKKYIVILLCILVSCCKREPSVGTHQGDNATVSPSKTKGIDGYVGKCHYMVWINDSAYQNKSFWLELRKR